MVKPAIHPSDAASLKIDYVAASLLGDQYLEEWEKERQRIRKIQQKTAKKTNNLEAELPATLGSVWRWLLGELTGFLEASLANDRRRSQRVSTSYTRGPRHTRRRGHPKGWSHTRANVPSERQPARECPVVQEPEDQDLTERTRLSEKVRQRLMRQGGPESFDENWSEPDEDDDGLTMHQKIERYAKQKADFEQWAAYVRDYNARSTEWQATLMEKNAALFAVYSDESENFKNSAKEKAREYCEGQLHWFWDAWNEYADEEQQFADFLAIEAPWAIGLPEGLRNNWLRQQYRQTPSVIEQFQKCLGC